MSQSFHEARVVRWLKGIRKHRNGDASAPFKGEPIEELTRKMLDAYNDLEEIERTTGANLSIAKGMCRFIARSIQTIPRK